MVDHIWLMGIDFGLYFGKLWPQGPFIVGHALKTSKGRYPNIQIPEQPSLSHKDLSTFTHLPLTPTKC